MVSVTYSLYSNAPLIVYLVVLGKKLVSTGDDLTATDKIISLPGYFLT